MSNFDETTEQPPLPADPLIGAMVGGKYRVLSALARGGMAQIYRAEQEPLGRIVALKVLKPAADSASDPGARFEDRFSLEAATCAKLKHPNTVTLFDYGHHAPTDSFYMVMELVEGRPLSAALRSGRLDVARAIGIGIEICRSLQEAHALGIVHRDLKPSNVMLADTHEGEHVKVLDFGIAKVLQGQSQEITTEDRLVGSPRYMAPEQISQGRIDARTDVYALGVMLFEMISGAAPYSGTTAIKTLMLHLNAPVPRLAEQPGCEHLAGALDELVACCMSKEALARPESVEALKQELRRCLAELTGASDIPRTESSVRSDQPVGFDLSTTREFHTQPTLDRPAGDMDTSFVGRAPVVIGVGGLTIGILLGLLLLGGGGGLLLYRWYEGARTEGTDEPLPTRIEPEVQPEPEPPAPPPILTLLSTPEGAEVFEGEVSLGLTPLELDIEPGAAARSFELRMEGYEPASVLPGAVEADVEIATDLVPRPTPRPRPAPSKKNPDLELIDER